jgi:hypothetical protein
MSFNDLLSKRTIGNGKCVNCGKKTNKDYDGVSVCYGYWSTWGCYYTEQMIEHDRKWNRQPFKYRGSYIATILTPKERKKLIRSIESIQQKIWVDRSCTTHKELLSYHDDRLRHELRNLEALRNVS